MPDGSTATDPRGFLMRFEDGPLGTKTHHVPMSAGWDWPLPDRLGVLRDGDRVVVWDAADGEYAVVYRKVRESHLPHGTELVVRGAEYRLEVADA